MYFIIIYFLISFFVVDSDQSTVLISDRTIVFVQSQVFTGFSCSSASFFGMFGHSPNWKLCFSLFSRLFFFWMISLARFQ